MAGGALKVGEYRTDGPPPEAPRRYDYATTDGFGHQWVAAMGGVRVLEHLLLNMVQSPSQPPTRIYASHEALTGEFEVRRIPAHTARDRLEKKLAVTTLIEDEGGYVSRKILRVLAHLLGVARKVGQRDRALTSAYLIAALETKGWTRTRSVEYLGQSARNAKESTTWEELSVPFVARFLQAHRAYFQGSLQRIRRPHLSDEWFERHMEDRVAAEILRSCSAGKPMPQKHRWDLFILIEGFVWRGRPLSAATHAALDRALKLDAAHHSMPLGGSLGGVKERRPFVALAKAKATYPELSLLKLLQRLPDDEVIQDAGAAGRWTRSQLFKASVAAYSRNVADHSIDHAETQA